MGVKTKGIKGQLKKEYSFLYKTVLLTKCKIGKRIKNQQTTEENNGNPK